MKIQRLLFTSYLISLSITIVMALIDSDPIISLSSILTDIFFMSILCWIVGFPISILVNQKKDEKQRSSS
jgi:ABC-type polysaccharide/polyol phosphate export permease